MAPQPLLAARSGGRHLRTNHLRTKMCQGAALVAALVWLLSATAPRTFRVGGGGGGGGAGGGGDGATDSGDATGVLLNDGLAHDADGNVLSYTEKDYHFDFANAVAELKKREEALEVSNNGTRALGYCPSQLGARYPIANDGTVLNVEKVPELSSQYVFRYNNYVKYTHMAVITQWGNVLFAAWQAAPIPPRFLERTSPTQEVVVEGLPEQRILYSISRDLGRTWEQPMALQLHSAGAVWSPVVHGDKTGRLWLFYSESTRCMRTSKVVNTWAPGGDIRIISLANTKSLSAGVLEPGDQPLWTLPRTILKQEDEDGVPKVIANKLTVLSTGTWVLPYWREAPEDGPCSELRAQPSAGRSGVLLSSDSGRTWNAFGSVGSPSTSLIEPSVVELRSGALLMLLRSSTGCVYRSTSTDGGRTWSLAEPTRLPNPNSKLHIMRLEPAGHLVMAFNNHRHAGADYGKSCLACRTNMNLAVSTDDGINWRRISIIDDERTPGLRAHYPTMLQVDTKLFVMYTRFYLYPDPGLFSSEQGVRVVTLDFSEVLKRDARPSTRQVPTRAMLLNVVSHLLGPYFKNNPQDVLRLGMRANRWKRLAGLLCQTYELSAVGGAAWLSTKKRFGNYAVKRVWSVIEPALSQMRGSGADDTPPLPEGSGGAVSEESSGGTRGEDDAASSSSSSSS